MSMVDKIVENHKSGYNCAQSVICAYSEMLGLDEEALKGLTSGIAVGMGTMEGSCGAVVAAAMVAGMLAQKKGLPGKDSFKLGKTISKKFLEKNTTVTCKDLKGAATGEVIRDCRGCVIDAAEILEEVLATIE